jgi:molecular chaperone DnaK (HSP70)
MSAKTAGIEEVYIVNEPTAAAMWIARDYRTTLLVFDLGGGTFDVSVVCNLYNCYDVLVTEGCAVGGNDFDKAITEYFLRTSHIAPYHLSNEQLQKLTWLATETKIKMQKERSAFRVDLTHFGAGYIDFTEKCYIKIMKRTFAKTIELTKQIIERAALGNADLKFAFAGGSTRCPYLREWVKEVFRQPIVPQNYDPDKVVGLGASYYAGMVEKGKIREYVSDVTKKLTIGYSDGTALTIIEEDSKIPINSDEIPIVNDKPCDTISLSIYEGNSNKVSENTFIGELRFRYSKFMESEEGLVIIQAKIDRSGIITFTAREPAGKTQEIQIKC